MEGVKNVPGVAVALQVEAVVDAEVVGELEVEVPERLGLDYGVGSDPSCPVFDEHAACVGARASQCMTLRHLSLHYRDRGKLGQDLHEVLLVGHHLVDVLVCAGCLV